jgi:hypothetical protein
MPSNFMSLHPRPGLIRLVVVFALMAMIVAMFNYLWAGNGIHGTEGALLVVASTALLAAAALSIMFGWVSGAVRGVLEVLMGLDYVGSAMASYLLEAWFLLALLAIGLVVWILHLLRPAHRQTVNS